MDDDAEFDRQALRELAQEVVSDAFPTEPVKVPLVIYIGTERHVIGEAFVADGKIVSYTETENGTLMKLLGSSELKHVTISSEPAELIPTIEHGLVPSVQINHLQILEEPKREHETGPRGALPSDFDEQLDAWDSSTSDYRETRIPDVLSKELGEDS